MKKAIPIGAIALVAMGTVGYLHARKKAPATPKPPPPWVAPILTDKSDDLDRVFAACGPPKSDRTAPDATKVFAGGALRTIDYGHDDAKLGHIAVYLNFDQPRTGWRFRGASHSLAASDPDLTLDQLAASLPCAATALDNDTATSSPAGPKAP